MTDIGESISVPAVDGPWECPFDHEGGQHDKENVLPPPNDKNDAKKLAAGIGEMQYFEFSCGGETCKGKLAAHHVLPGNEAWPKSNLHKWINKKDKNHVKGDIGYDVNDGANGVNLGDDEFFPLSKASKQDYAFAMMKARNRQFHDRHPAYSDWVINRLNKIAERIEAEVGSRGGKGCGKDNCPLEQNAKKPFDPPYHVLGRLYAMASSIKQLLVGSPKKWRMPVMTSRFALMYKEGVTEDAARKRLAAARSKLKG
jgi:hypothetical protein